MSDRAAPMVRPEAEEDWGAVSMKQTTRFDEECRRALALLAESPDGCTRAIMLAHGFSLALTASLIRGGLATDQMAKRVGSGTRPIARVRITDAGLRALAEPHSSTGSAEPL